MIATVLILSSCFLMVFGLGMALGDVVALLIFTACLYVLLEWN